MHIYIMDMLVCPACHGALQWTITQQGNDRIEEAETRCKSCSRSYPVREGIGIFLTDELQRNDLWEQVESGLMKYLKSQPELYQQLMNAPLEGLSPADRSFRGMLLEELGKLAEARQAWQREYQIDVDGPEDDDHSGHLRRQPIPARSSTGPTL